MYVRELSIRPGRRGANVVSIDSGAGLSNATLQQRLVPVRLLYDFLIEEGLRESNPVGRGRYTPGRGGAGSQRGLVPWLLRVRAETTKNRRERVVPYSAATGVLLSEYLRHRATISRA